MELDLKKIAEDLLKEYETSATVLVGKEQGVREFFARITQAATKLAEEAHGQEASKPRRKKKTGE